MVISAKKYAEHRGVSPMAVTKWIRAGILGPLGDVVQKSGRLYFIDLERADVLIEMNKKVTLQGFIDAKPTDGKQTGSLYHRSRSVEAQYRAALTRLEYEVKTGVYVLAEDVRAAAFNQARAVRDALLNIPDRVSPVLATETDPQAVNSIMAREIRQALTELSRETRAEAWQGKGPEAPLPAPFPEEGP